MPQQRKEAVESGLANRFSEGLYYSKSDEKFVLRALFDQILGDRAFAHALDVGPGQGHVSEPLARRSRKLTMVERLPQYEAVLKRRFENAEVVIAPIAEAELTERFDAILFSHVLYYQPEDTWMELTRKLYEMLVPGGELIVVLNADSGDWWRLVGTYFEDLKPHIGFYYVPLTTFRKQCAQLAAVKTHPYRYQLWIEQESWIDFVSKSILELVDEEVIERHRPSFSALAKQFKQMDGSYVLDMRCEIIRLLA